MSTLAPWLSVAAGGALGAMARYGLVVATFPMFGNRFPLATLLANVLGSLAIGICYALIVERGLLPPQWRLPLMIGFLGAFTTFSTFALDALVLWQNGHGTTATLYVALNLVLCIAAAAGGLHLTLKLT